MLLSSIWLSILVESEFSLLSLSLPLLSPSLPSFISPSFLLLRLYHYILTILTYTIYIHDIY